MRPPLLVLAAFLLIPGAAAAQSLDAGDGSEPPVLEAEDTAIPSDSKLGDLEEQVKSKGPLALEPKFDLTDEQPEALSGTSSLNQVEPLPAPGFVLKIPTN
jgi:hypothetical protein